MYYRCKQQKDYNVYVFCAMDARWDDFFIGISFTKSCVSNVLFPNQNFLHTFYNVLVLDSLSFLYFELLLTPDDERGLILKSKHNNENMRFIRLPLANQIAHIFPSNDSSSYHCMVYQMNIFSIYYYSIP